MKLRSLLYVPADNARFVAKAAARGADAVILDLEDSVLAPAKTAAREGLSEAVRQVAAQGAAVAVRINAGDIDDARAAVRAGAGWLLVPKVQGPATLSPLIDMLASEEAAAGRPETAVIAMIEDPGAMLDARAIARVPRVRGLMAGGEDLATAMHASPDPEVLRLPKLLVHYAAKAEGRLSFGLLRSVADYTDLPAISAAAQEARSFGFDGATCVHPSAVPLLNRGFAPSREEIEWARKVLAGPNGRGAYAVEGRMIDAPVLARARRILDEAR